MHAESQVPGLDVLVVDGTGGTEKTVYVLEERDGEWRAVHAVVDSGAEETVAPPGLFPGKVEQSAMQLVEHEREPLLIFQ